MCWLVGFMACQHLVGLICTEVSLTIITPISRLSQKFCIICVHACLQYIYHMTEAVQAMQSIVHG